jgi:hypothetical protein
MERSIASVTKPSMDYAGARAMSAAKLVPDEELAGLGDRRGPGSAEAYILLELREARSTGENVFAFRDHEGHYTIEHLSSGSSFEHRAAHVFLSPPSV